MSCHPADPSPIGAARNRWSHLSLAVRLALVVSSLMALAIVMPGPDASADGVTRAYGSQPADDILYWAGQYATCAGLSQNQLAAMMVAPTFEETGAVAASAPSPMTMSRWDTQSALYAFGNTATPYRGAFWSPGVGLWQFDSAGGWNLTAATAINTSTSAQQAAQVMGGRYCRSQAATVVDRMRYAWGPWSACASTNICLDYYNQVFDGTNFVVNRLAGVTRSGGMQTRNCAVQGLGNVTCYFVDPARAEGDKGWATTSSAIPTPLTKPFYVFEVNGREYRYWLLDDSGYNATVMASKPVTANARTSLTWGIAAAGNQLCDLDAGKGVCGWTGWRSMGGSVRPEGSVATNADGRLEVLLVGTDGLVYDSWQYAPSAGWAPPVAFATSPSSIVSVVGARNAGGFLEGFALDTGGALWHAQQTATGWTAWSVLSRGLSGSLGVGTNSDGRLEVFGRDGGGGVVHQWQIGAGGWSGWYPMGTGPVVSLTVGSNADGRIEVFAVGSNGRLIHSWQMAPNASYSPWLATAGLYVGRVSVVRNVDGRMEVFARGADNSLWDLWQIAPNAPWAGPAGIGPVQLGGDPIGARNRDGRLEVFAVLANATLGDLWQYHVGGPWSGVATLPGPALQSPVTGAVNGDGHLVLLTPLADGTLAVNTQLV